MAGVWFLFRGRYLFEYLFGEPRLEVNLETAHFHVVLQSHHRADRSRQNQGVDYVLITLQGRIENHYSRAMTLKNPRLSCSSVSRMNDLSFQYEPRHYSRLHNPTRFHVEAGGTAEFVLRRVIENYTLFDGISELEAELVFDLPYGRVHAHPLTLTRTENSNFHRDIQDSLSPDTQWGAST